MSTLRHQFDWLPDPLGSILLLCAAALIALLLSRRITGTLPRLPGLRKVQFIHAIINRLRVNISYFLIIIAASAALLATEGFSPKTETFLAHALDCLFIMNLGFGIIRAFRLITDQYLNRISSRETWMTSRSAPIRRRSVFWGV